MASSPLPEPLTVQVSDIAQATSFYLAALSPLGYGFISKIQHQTATASSEAVGIGPAGSSRVDVFLSQSTRVGAGLPNSAHVVFPATTTYAVRDFYAAALQAGGRPVARPDNLAASDGKFASVITDNDGNRIEVCFGDAVASPEASSGERAASVAGSSQANGPIQQWRESVADSTADISVASSRTPRPAPTAAPTASLKSAVSAARSMAASQPVRTAMSAASGASQASSKRSGTKLQGGRSTQSSRKASVFPTPSGNVGGKTVVGTLIGAAAGAALAYTVVKSKQDSQEQQDEHERRLRSDQVRAEARAHCDATDRGQVTGKIDMVDRDSGYGSGSQYSASPSLLNPRGVTYPQPSTDTNSSRGRPASRKLLDFGPRAVSANTYYQAPSARKQSVDASSQSTVRSARRSQSNRPRSSHSTQRLHSPSNLLAPPPGPPSMPAALPTRSRRNSYSGQPPSSLARQNSVRNQPPSSFSRAMGDEGLRSEASPSLKRAPSSQGSTRTARNVPLPSSVASSPSTARPPTSYRSARTARQVPLPESEVPSGQKSHRSSITARWIPLPPSEASSKLTARALSHQNEPQASKIENNLDEMATVVPDDSISCVSERDERRERESHASGRPRRTGSKASRRSSVPAS